MGAMRENNENLLAVAWWVILNSPDLLMVLNNDPFLYEQQFL